MSTRNMFHAAVRTKWAETARLTLAAFHSFAAFQLSGKQEMVSCNPRASDNGSPVTKMTRQYSLFSRVNSIFQSYLCRCGCSLNQIQLLVRSERGEGEWPQEGGMLLSTSWQEEVKGGLTWLTSTWIICSLLSKLCLQQVHIPLSLL